MPAGGATAQKVLTGDALYAIMRAQERDRLEHRITMVQAVLVLEGVSSCELSTDHPAG
jgi:hypothetical protein